MNATEKRHYEELRALLERAHAPYSEFRVAARLEPDEGAAVDGVNVENASYGLGLCAERVALVRALTAGHRRFSRIYILSSGDRPVSPCGACREALFRVAPQLEVVMLPAAPGGGALRLPLADLLPS